MVLAIRRTGDRFGVFDVTPLADIQLGGFEDSFATEEDARRWIAKEYPDASIVGPT